MPSLPYVRLSSPPTAGREWCPSAVVLGLILSWLVVMATPAAAQTGRTSNRLELSGGYVAVEVQQGETLASLAQTYLGSKREAWRIARFNGVESVAAGDLVIVPPRGRNPGGVRPGSYQTVPVLSYHKFSEKPSDGKTTVSRQQFEQQMAYLRDNGYSVVSLEAVLDFMEYEASPPPRSVAITIDDGWASTYEIAYPILKKYDYPATLFVYTGLIEEEGGNLAMSWEQIRELSQNGIDIECQSRSHRSFAKPKRSESFRDYFMAIDAELTHTEKTLREQVGVDCDVLSYPYGQTNPLVIALAKEHDLRGAFTLTRLTNPFFADRYRIGRAMIFNDFDLDDFAENLVVDSSEALQ